MLSNPKGSEVGPTRVEEQHHPRPTYGALDHTAELLAKLLSGSEDPDVTALSEAIKAKLGIAEPLPKPELPSLSPGLSTLAEDLKRSRVSRLLPKVTCPSPFHPRASTVPMAHLQDVPVTEIDRRGLSALAPLAGVSPSGLTPGGGKTGRPIAQANIQLELPEFDPKKLPDPTDWPIQCGCGHQMFTAKTLMQKEMFAKTGETDCENLFYLGRGIPEVGENIPSL